MRLHVLYAALVLSLLVSCGVPPVEGMDADAPDAGSEDASADDASTADTGAEDASARSAHADVIAVSASGADGAYTFAVAIESSDTGCEQYADWWEVLSAEGELRYRRTLAHSHTDANGTTDADAPGNRFTRSGGPVPVTADEPLIVRAHLSPVGYVGRAMRGSVNAGFEPYETLPDFADGLREAVPQPPPCAF